MMASRGPGDLEVTVYAYTVYNGVCAIKDSKWGRAVNHEGVGVATDMILYRVCDNLNTCA